MNSSTGQNSNRQKANQNIQVYVRVRPLNARERGIRSMEVVQVASPKEICVNHLTDFKSTKKFTFDRTFGPDSKQSEVYQVVVAPLIEEVLSGYNCTVFAYGQTGTGKTHTMVGNECPELKSSWEDESMVGIIPRALSHLFDELRMLELEFSMRISYLELYNEELCDLLSSDDSARIRIFDDSTKKGSVIVQGLEEIPVHSKDDVYKLLEKGKERRKTATTLMNAQSSRSHTVFSILVHIKENNIDGEEMLKIGKLNLVDLAGSENISKSGNEKGIRARETVNINQSLLTLGRVITALVERTPHIPYRESKLTRLLQESLGGRTKTSIIATISPGHKDQEETLSTLEYAHRAKNIQNRPEVNQKLTKKTVLKEYTEEIDKLKRDLMAARDKNGIYLAEETYNDIQFKLDSQNRELTEKMLLIKALKDDLANKERIFNEVSLHLVEKSEELNKKEKFLEQTKTELDQTKRALNITKKRSKEKQVLLENHVQTEEQLTSQALQILEVADVATTDTEKLHSTIERRKTVDSQIKNTCTQFVNKMNATFEGMSKQLEDLWQDHSSHYQIILDEISSSTKMNQQFTENAIKKISKISNHHETCLFELNNLVEKHSEKVGDNYVIHKSAFNAMMNNLKIKEATATQNIEECFMEITRHITNQNEVLVKNYSNIMQLSSSNNIILKQFSEKIQQNLTETIKTVKDKFDEKQNKMNSVIQNKILINENRNKCLMEFLKHMQTLEKEDSSAIEEQKTIAEFDTIMKSLDSDLNNQIKLVTENTSQLENNIAKTETILTDFTSSMNQLNDKCTTESANGCVTISGFHDENKAQIEDIISFHDKHVENISTLVETYKQDIGAKVTCSSEKMQQICQSTSELITSETNRTKHRETENLALATSLQNCVKSYNSNYRNNLENCKQSLEDFHTQELKTYSSTGETPSKRQFSYPKVLASTSPHDLIIKRFRYENEYSDLDSTSVMEDSEITLPEMSDNLVMVNSTPLRIGGNEILEPLEQNIIKSIQNMKPPKIQSRKNSPAIYCNKDNKENTY